MTLYKGRKLILAASVLGALGISSSALAELDFTYPDTLSENGGASKTKLVRLGSGWLVSPYGDSAGPPVYDTKADAIRPARDIFVRVCHPDQNDSKCSDANDWSEPVNLSNTAGETSIDTDWDEDLDLDTSIATPFYGDSDKPNIFNAGPFAVVTWVDKYCPGGDQLMVEYIERDGITMPFSCLYMAYTNNPASGVWTTERITDGSRDAKSDANKGLSIGTPAKGHWSIVWQEDPRGLQLGGAEGPGDGASGAKVTHGTDVWYTYTEDLMSGSWSEPVRVTDNYTSNSSGGNANPVFHPEDPEEELGNLESGKTGASRPNLALVGGSTPATALIAYEESKGSDRTDAGKFIRYHEFPFSSPPESAGELMSGEPGCLISDPLENSRRVRFVAQPTASANGLRMGVFWRQGLPTEGGPADIMLRLGKVADGSSGLRPEDMEPAVDSSCRTSDYTVAKALEHDSALNLSSNTTPWAPVSNCDIVEPADPDNDLGDASYVNPYEDARAHRAAIVGDDLYVGYSYVMDWAVSTYTDMDNYNFWLRHYNAEFNTWTTAMNLSGIDEPDLNVKEPRLVKTPGTGTGCTDPLNITNPENCQDKSTLIAAWGTETNVYSHVEASEELDIYYTRTRNKAVTFEDAVVVPDIGESNRFESQLRPTPAGNIVFAVWNEKDSFGDSLARISVSDESGVEPPMSDYDLSLRMVIPDVLMPGESSQAKAVVSNLGPDDLMEEAVITIVGVSNEGKTFGPHVKVFDSLPGDGVSVSRAKILFTAPDDGSTRIDWTMTVTSPSDTNPSNDEVEGKTKIRE